MKVFTQHAAAPIQFEQDEIEAPHAPSQFGTAAPLQMRGGQGRMPLVSQEAFLEDLLQALQLTQQLKMPSSHLQQAH